MMDKNWQRAAAMVTVIAGVLASGAAWAQSAPAQLLLSSPAFTDGGRMLKPHVCADMKNFSRHSPQLSWTGVPDGTKSFALIMHDADTHIRKAAADALHWMIWNIPGGSTALAANQPLEHQLPDGVRQSKSVIGQPGYMGPCAPAGKPHHYVFELYALDIMLDVSPEGTRDDVLKAMDGHVLGSSILVGLFNQ